MRLAVSCAVALETSRGWKISKEKATHKIDVVVALAMACHATVQGQAAPPVIISQQLLARLQTLPPRRAERRYAMPFQPPADRIGYGAYHLRHLKN
jgi:hypothetical protein